MKRYVDSMNCPLCGGLLSFFSHIKKEYMAMIMAVFISYGMDAQGLSLDKKKIFANERIVQIDNLGKYPIQFYDKNGNNLVMDTVDWSSIAHALMNKPLNALNFLEAQQLFYLYFGPGLASQEYIKRSNGHPDLLIRILILSTVEKRGNFASFNPGVVWDENLGKYKKLSTITNRGTFQIHAHSYGAMRKKYARYLQSGLAMLDFKSLAGVSVMDWPLTTVSEINVFENHVKDCLGKDLLNQQKRSLADAQMDLIVHLKYLDIRDKMFSRIKGRSLWNELADPNLSRDWLAQLISYWVQGGKPIIGKTFLKRENYTVKFLLDHPRAQGSGSNFLQVLMACKDTFPLDSFPQEYNSIPSKDTLNPMVLADLGDVGETILDEKMGAPTLGIGKIHAEEKGDPIGNQSEKKIKSEETKNSSQGLFEQTIKIDFVLNKFEKILDNHEDYFLLEVQKGGLDGGPIPTFYNFAVTLVDMGFMQTKDILPFLARIKTSCRGSSFAFSEYQLLHPGEKVRITTTVLDNSLVDNRRELAISSIKTISR